MTLVLGWLEAGFGSVSQLQCVGHIPKAKILRCILVKGMNVTSRPRKDGLAVRAETPSTYRSNRKVVASCQSAAAAPAGCCFIISSIPFFISLAVGSDLCVPTIHV